jgi:hypothetical protein
MRAGGLTQKRTGYNKRIVRGDKEYRNKQRAKLAQNLVFAASFREASGKINNGNFASPFRAYECLRILQTP